MDLKTVIKLRKGVLEALDLASSQNKKIQQIVDDQYKLLKNLTLQLGILQDIEKEYLKESE